MDKAKRTMELSRSESEQAATAAAPSEVQTLSDLELVLCGGGDSVITWPG